jgi:glycosyltransferase involved in cell wall biosynthesis
MAEGKRVGLFFSYNEKWIGGTYYIINLIEALKLLPPWQQPQLTIFYTNREDIARIKTINYPTIDFAEVNYRGSFLKRLTRFLVRKVFKKQIFKPGPYRNYRRRYFDAIFPAPTWFKTSIARKTIYWIADFQEAYLPQFFSKEEIANRKKTQLQIAASYETLILSSNDALKDFEKMYPKRKVKTRVLQFAVIHPDYSTAPFEEIKRKYGLPENYFFCPNQFWVHKNQKLLLKGMIELRHKFNKEIQVVFTGKAHDHRNDTYYQEFEKLIKENGLEKNIITLGFIDRMEQLQIMKHALAVIQPSLFEGWSTVVEDAKAMNQDIIASDLNVHKEQLNGNALFFDPYDSYSLAEAINEFEKKKPDFNYDIKRLNFAKNFLSIVNE